MFFCILRHSDIIPKGQGFWDQSAIDKFKELVGKCSEIGMIAIGKGIKSGPAGDVMLVVLIDTVTNNLENGIQMHQEMHRLNLADWNDSGYSSSPIPNKGTSKPNTPMMLEQGK